MKQVKVTTGASGTTVNLVCPSDPSANKTGTTNSNREVTFSVDESKQYNKAVVQSGSKDHIVSQV